MWSMLPACSRWTPHSGETNPTLAGKFARQWNRANDALLLLLPVWSSASSARTVAESTLSKLEACSTLPQVLYTLGRMSWKTGNYCAARALSIAPVSSADSGSTLESKRERILPSLLIRNLPKFHFTGPGTGELAPVNAA